MDLWPSWIGPHHVFGEREAEKADSMSELKLPEGPHAKEKAVDALPLGQWETFLRKIEPTQLLQFNAYLI